MEAIGKIDSVGCPLDTDQDGVPDYIDQCPNTPMEAIGKIDTIGCPLDTDQDGVPDYIDQCPETPVEAFGKINSLGCPLDTDEDGIPDYLDKCPTTKGPAHTNGCPEIKQEVKTLFTKALQGIQFETGKDILLKSSLPILNDIVKVMNENPEYNLSIAGHTDNQGNPLKNLDLSERRALAVKLYLIKNGIDANRLTSAGYGDTKPVTDNKTAAGRKQNRRVEFTVEFEVIETITTTQEN
jgi:outer membrane protein OmpA-like peptidoglycan-associated protein